MRNDIYQYIYDSTFFFFIRMELSKNMSWNIIENRKIRFQGKEIIFARSLSFILIRRRKRRGRDRTNSPSSSAYSASSSFSYCCYYYLYGSKDLKKKMSSDFNQDIDERTNLLSTNQQWNTIFFSSFSSPGSNRSYGSLSSCHNIFQSIWSRNKQVRVPIHIHVHKYTSG